MLRTLLRLQLIGWCVVTILVSMQTAAEATTNPCRYWQSRVDDAVRISEKVPQPNESDPQTVMTGIECLLKLEGDKHEAKFSGAVNNEVSQIFEHTSAGVAALYYISYLYYQKWDHANAVALQGKNGAINTRKVIREAYRSYKKWFLQVKRVGLAQAREMKLDPLRDTKVRWY